MRHGGCGGEREIVTVRNIGDSISGRTVAEITIKIHENSISVVMKDGNFKNQQESAMDEEEEKRALTTVKKLLSLWCMSTKKKDREREDNK